MSCEQFRPQYDFLCFSLYCISRIFLIFPLFIFKCIAPYHVFQPACFYTVAARCCISELRYQFHATHDRWPGIFWMVILLHKVRWKPGTFWFIPDSFYLSRYQMLPSMWQQNFFFIISGSFGFKYCSGYRLSCLMSCVHFFVPPGKFRDNILS